jgi:hypothetical protein
MYLRKEESKMSFYRKILVSIILVVLYSAIGHFFSYQSNRYDTQVAIKQLDESINVGEIRDHLNMVHYTRNNGYFLGWFFIVLIILFIFFENILKFYDSIFKKIETDKND